MTNPQEQTGINSSVTPRELEIIQKMSEGLSTKQIADALGISKNTVEIHRHNIIQKTGCRNCTHVVFTFAKLGFV